jgi:type II secretory pathway component GspD/PulD (secretin)
VRILLEKEASETHFPAVSAQSDLPKSEESAAATKVKRGTVEAPAAEQAQAEQIAAERQRRPQPSALRRAPSVPPVGRPVAPQPPKPAEERESTPAAAPGTISLDAVDTDLVDLLRGLAAQMKANIVVAPDVKMSVTISLRNVTLKEALDAIVRISGLEYREVNGTYYVATKQRMQELFPPLTVSEFYVAANAPASELYQKLLPLCPGVTFSVQPPNKLLMSGSREAVEKAKALASVLDVPPPPPVEQKPPEPEQITEVYEVKYLDINAAKAFVTEMFPTVTTTNAPAVALPPSVEAAGGGRLQAPVSATVQSSLLVLRGPKDAVERCVETLKSLDVPPRQVEIEARVVDLNTNLDEQRGFSWTWQPFDIVEGIVGAPQLEDAPIVGGITPRPRQGRDFFRFGTFSRSATELQVVIDALVNSGAGRVLAEPRIRVVNGSSGRIFIGDTVTYLVSRDVTPTGTSVNTSQVQAGVRLEVAPRIVGDGTVLLGIDTEVSTLTSLAGGLPSTSERRARTSVMVKDGETIAIGGLLKDEDIESLRKFPFLGDLPFFGNLFRSRNKSKKHSELVIFLTTRLAQPQDAAGVDSR